MNIPPCQIRNQNNNNLFLNKNNTNGLQNSQISQQIYQNDLNLSSARLNDGQRENKSNNRKRARQEYEQNDTEAGAESQSQENSNPASSDIHVQTSLSPPRHTQQQSDKPRSQKRRRYEKSSNIPICKYYQMGKCKLGTECPFRHVGPVLVNRKNELCKFYLIGACNKSEEECKFSHNKKMFPCRFFHLFGTCHKTESTCEFSHAPISEKERQQLQRVTFFRDSKHPEDDAYSIHRGTNSLMHMHQLGTNAEQNLASPPSLINPAEFFDPDVVDVGITPASTCHNPFKSALATHVMLDGAPVDVAEKLSPSCCKPIEPSVFNHNSYPSSLFSNQHDSSPLSAKTTVPFVNFPPTQYNNSFEPPKRQETQNEQLEEEGEIEEEQQGLSFASSLF